uniref:Uma2 family endonuclease n=1 Tax=Crocosphaera sp. TaxID=2729996 RepID=UPI00261B031F
LGSNRSPDVAYIQQERWDKLTQEEKEKFPPIAPDFVLELKSKTDSLKQVQEKMEEYMDNGVKLGWLINPEKKQVEVYRQGQEKEILENPQTLSGEDILPEFILDLALMW